MTRIIAVLAIAFAAVFLPLSIGFFIYGWVVRHEISQVLGGLALGLSWMIWSAVRDLKEARHEEEEVANSNSKLLDPFLSLGMDQKEAIQKISGSFQVNRLPRHYSTSTSNSWIEFDTNAATFVVFTKNGIVTGWSSK